MFYFFVKFVILWVPLHLFFRPWVQGKKNIPKKGAAIFASNHISFSDSIFLPLVVRRKITFLAKIDYWRGKGIRGFFTKLFFNGVGQVPVDRAGGSAAESALNTAIKILNDGKFLGIYPEGTRAPDGRLYRGRTGVARMALEAQVPVIPVAMIGTYEIQPPGQAIPSLGRVGVRFGKPLDFSQYYGEAKNVEVLRKVTNEIMQAIHKLSGQEYVDIYASNAKEILKKGKRIQDELNKEGEN
ncbi:MAG: lysophospholipid acyltransferase family protein [Candidatus Nanopelagicales bacterium]